MVVGGDCAPRRPLAREHDAALKRRNGVPFREQAVSKLGFESARGLPRRPLLIETRPRICRAVHEMEDSGVIHRVVAAQPDDAGLKFVRQVFRICGVSRSG
jgi:hypothetical protein